MPEVAEAIKQAGGEDNCYAARDPAHSSFRVAEVNFARAIHLTPPCLLA